MTVEVTVAGRARQVDVRWRGDGWDVTVDGRALQARVSDAGGRWSLLIGARSHEVTLDERESGDYLVHVDGDPVVAALAPSRWRRGRGGRSGADAAPRRGSRPETVTVAAPMPGRVVKVLVDVGDLVSARQPLVVVEAMKMENELRAPRAGTVREVRVSEGLLVEPHSPLVVIE